MGLVLIGGSPALERSVLIFCILGALGSVLEVFAGDFHIVLLLLSSQYVNEKV